MKNDMTVKQLLHQSEEFGGCLVQIILRDSNDNPIAVVAALKSDVESMNELIGLLNQFGED